MATDQFGSGGGFSHWIPRDPEASYQDDAVSAYLSSVDTASPFPPADAFNKDGRANPDVSALGEGFNIVLDGHVVAIGGTSASTPLFAGLVGLLNEARLAKGGKPLGFLNPFIYQNADAFNDVTTGKNNGCGSTGGFPAAKGWDAATGVGTPNYQKLLKAVQALP